MPLANKPAPTAITVAPAPEQAIPKKVVLKPVTAKGDTMSKAEWASKDVRISRQGLFQAALQSTGLLQLNGGNTFDAYMELVEKAAERGLQFVNKTA